MPDSKEIVFSMSDAGGLWRLDVTGKKPATRLPYVGENGWMPTVARAQAGRRTRLAYARSFSDVNIWRLDTSTPGAKPSSPPRVAISSTRWDYGGDFSPDGRRVAFASIRSGEPEIWVTDLGGSDAVQLTSMRAQSANAPRWSPDGRLIAFQSNLEGQFDVYVVPAAGGPPRRITSHPANDHVPNFSHDGRTIYFSSMRSGTYEIWKVGVSGGDPVQVTRGGGFQGREGRDGAYLYYTRTPGGPNALWRMPTSGERPVELLDGITGSAFAVLERKLQDCGSKHGRSPAAARRLPRRSHDPLQQGRLLPRRPHARRELQVSR
jgi:Tol biopolymer transport system component